jgi:hypothetical protein
VREVGSPEQHRVPGVLRDRHYAAVQVKPQRPRLGVGVPVLVDPERQGEHALLSVDVGLQHRSLLIRRYVRVGGLDRLAQNPPDEVLQLVVEVARDGLVVVAVAASYLLIARGPFAVLNQRTVVPRERRYVGVAYERGEHAVPIAAQMIAALCGEFIPGCVQTSMLTRGRHDQRRCESPYLVLARTARGHT